MKKDVKKERQYKHFSMKFPGKGMNFKNPSWIRSCYTMSFNMYARILEYYLPNIFLFVITFYFLNNHMRLWVMVLIIQGYVIKTLFDFNLSSQSPILIIKLFLKIHTPGIYIIYHVGNSKTKLFYAKYFFFRLIFFFFSLN